MAVVRMWTILLCLYVSGLSLYSSLFIFSNNQFLPFQIGKVAIASLHCLIFLPFVFMAQARFWLVRIIGYLGLAGYFGYVFFLTGYFSYFGFVPEIYTLGVANVADVAAVMNHYFLQIFGIREVILIICALALVYLIPRQKLPVSMLWLLLLPIGLFAINLAQFGKPLNSANFGNASVIRRFGLPTFYYYSVQEWMRFQSGFLAGPTVFPGNLSNLVYPGSIPADAATRVFSAEPSKVILVQIESLDHNAIGTELNGQRVMPFTATLRDTRCLEYTRFYTTKSVGGSADAEFSVATGRLPSSKRQSVRHADFSQITTLYDILAEHGIASYFAHNNNVGFYGRNLAYQQLSNVQSTFLKPNEEMDERAFAISTLKEAINASERIFYYFFNFQSHGPYKGYTSATKEHFKLSSHPGIDMDYLATMHEVDQTIAAMFAEQQSDFEAGESLFIVTADHPSYLNSDTDFLSRVHIPMLLCHQKLTGGKRDEVASNIDLFPTLLDAFGLLDEHPALGNSLLRGGQNIVLFPNGKILAQKDGSAVISKTCDEECLRYFNYTDQFIAFSN